MTSKHTPGPYSQHGFSLGTVVAVHDGHDDDGSIGNDGRHQHTVARCEKIEDAARITLTLNAFEPLVAALEAAVTAHGPFGDDTRPDWWPAACRALAKARGEG